ncbi:unnamed protein product [Schistocephalus solidus]|uniref:Uncharacterized protein n=1 Tax=Schistocephalus solidus TaxID=70667 RepID=A0A183TN96_SCHSO|nr:unnamed protein product [Schistocephalus solidus]
MAYEAQVPLVHSTTLTPTSSQIRDYKRTVCELIGLEGHLRTQCNNNPTTPLAVSVNVPFVTPALAPTATPTQTSPITSAHISDASTVDQRYPTITSTTSATTIMPITSKLPLSFFEEEEEDKDEEDEEDEEEEDEE